MDRNLTVWKAGKIKLEKTQYFIETILEKQNFIR